MLFFCVDLSVLLFDVVVVYLGKCGGLVQVGVVVVCLLLGNDEGSWWLEDCVVESLGEFVGVVLVIGFDVVVQLLEGLYDMVFLQVLDYELIIICYL